ncbi:uncharacterized protein LOC126904098 [Daktulosphaira vitifoliae]|uniref:uncharacterized protein LOC126904098 n=1 Tax=Daktulosphaira vitifoliae TaxID=58002 RepID=UPI0021AA955B|nr:uncharacterized protein LOC126904098 [Daktulosphaira vitifoliae]
MALSKLTIIKFLEIALTLIIFVLHYYSFPNGGENGEIMIITGTYVGYVIILAGILIGIFTGTPISSKLDMLFVLIGAALYILSGVLSYKFFNNYWIGNSSSYVSTGMTKAWLSVINGIVFIVDAVFTYREK